MTIDKTKLRGLAEAATPGEWDFDTAMSPYQIQGGEVVGGDGLPYGDVYTIQEFEGIDEEGETCSEPLTIVQECGIANGRFIAAANPAAILALLEELQAMTTERDELKRLARAYLDAMDAEAKAGNSCKIAEENYSNPKREQAAHEKALIAAIEALRLLRVALIGK